MLGSATIVERKYRYRHMRCSTAQRRGKEACAKPIVRPEVLEGQVAAYIGGLRIPPEYLGAMVEELRQRRSAAAEVAQRPRLERELERWRRLFVLGDIDEERYRREALPLRRHLSELERPPEALHVEQALSYLRDVGSLWAESPRPFAARVRAGSPPADRRGGQRDRQPHAAAALRTPLRDPSS
jgi:hypothetical protein